MVLLMATPANPDTRAVQEWATAFHNVLTRMKEALERDGDLQAVLDGLWLKNEHLPRVRDGIEQWLRSNGLEPAGVFTPAD